MPELPEVETVRRGLAAYLPGRQVAGVDVLHDRAVRRHVAGPSDFGARLRGRTITEVARRGKYLWLGTDAGWAVVGHLGMSGQLLLPEPSLPDSVHLRVRVRLTDSDRQLHFVDQRTFGGLLVSELAAASDGRSVPQVIAHVAPDPLEAAFDEDAFVRRLRSRRTGIKRALLDQTLVSGIGNIYADEALWRARLHFDRPTASLSVAQAKGVLAVVRDVLADALAAGGTSFDSLYVNVNGESGWFSRDLAAYGQQGRPCRRCGAAIRRERFMNRSSYTCPRCQRRPRTRSSTP